MSWANERIVVDSGSTDRTREVAEENKARFIVHIQTGQFNIAAQRNWVLEEVVIASDWILFLDADEEVTPALRAEIEKELARCGAKNAFELTPRYMFWGRWLKRTQGYPNWHSRLVKKGDVRFRGGVWEHFDETACIGRIAEPYDHYANSKGFGDWLERHDRYSTWEAQRIVAFLESRDPEAIGTKRKVQLRLWAARCYPLRPLIRFVYIYVIRLGFLEGMPALIFSIQYALFEWLVVLKVLDLRRRHQGKEL